MQTLLNIIEAASLKLQSLDWGGLSDAESREYTTRSFAQKQRDHGVFLYAVHNLDTRPDAVAGARKGKGCLRYLTESSVRRNSAQAHRDIEAARALVAPDADPAQGGLPRLGAAIASGKASEEHGRVALSMMKKIPSKLLSGIVEEKDNPDPWTEGRARVGGDVIDELLTEQALANCPASADYLAKKMLRALDPDGEDGFDPNATERRELNLTTDSTGMVTGRFQLDPVTGEWLMTAIDTYSAPEPKRTEIDEDGNEVVIKDTRTATQRRADALGLIARIALAAKEAGTRGAERPRIVVQTGLGDLMDVTAPDEEADADCGSGRGCEQSDTPMPPEQDTSAHNGPPPPDDPEHQNNASNHGQDQPPAQPDQRRDRSRHRSPKQTRGDRARYGDHIPSTPIGYPETSTGHLVPPRLLGRYVCDAVLQAVTLTYDGGFLNLGREVRTVTPAQRRALVARDGGCVIAGCNAPAHLCEGHHVKWFRNGGATDIANLALVCHRHHTDIHSGTWELEMRFGIPWSRPPEWVRADRPWLRNTYRQSDRDNRNTGTQLRLNIDDD